MSLSVRVRNSQYLQQLSHTALVSPGIVCAIKTANIKYLPAWWLYDMTCMNTFPTPPPPPSHPCPNKKGIVATILILTGFSLLGSMKQISHFLRFCHCRCVIYTLFVMHSQFDLIVIWIIHWTPFSKNNGPLDLNTLGVHWLLDTITSLQS